MEMATPHTSRGSLIRSPANRGARRMDTFRRFFGPPDDAVWDLTTFSKNRERLQSRVQKFKSRPLIHPQVDAPQAAAGGGGTGLREPKSKPQSPRL